MPNVFNPLPTCMASTFPQRSANQGKWTALEVFVDGIAQWSHSLSATGSKSYEEFGRSVATSEGPAAATRGSPQIVTESSVRNTTRIVVDVAGAII